MIIIWIHITVINHTFPWIGSTFLCWNLLFLLILLSLPHHFPLTCLYFLIWLPLLQPLLSFNLSLWFILFFLNLFRIRLLFYFFLFCFRLNHHFLFFFSKIICFFFISLVLHLHSLKWIAKLGLYFRFSLIIWWLHHFRSTFLHFLLICNIGRICIKLLIVILSIFDSHFFYNQIELYLRIIKM